MTPCKCIPGSVVATTPPKCQKQQRIPLKSCWPRKQQQLPPVIFLFFFFFLELSVGFIAGGQHYQTPASPPSHHPRRALGVCEASAPSFCSYLVWSGPVAPGWKAEGGQPASCEESPGFLLVWEAWRRITKRRYEILKSSKEERGGPTNTHRHTIIKNKKERKIKSVTETHTYLKPGVFSLVSWNQQLEFDTHACVRLCMCVRMCVCVCVCVCLFSGSSLLNFGWRTQSWVWTDWRRLTQRHTNTSNTTINGVINNSCKATSHCHTSPAFAVKSA